jgi:hypothetical protein
MLPPSSGLNFNHKTARRNNPERPLTKSGVLNLFQTWATFTLAHRLADRKVISEDNSLKSHDNLLKMLLN